MNRPRIKNPHDLRRFLQDFNLPPEGNATSRSAGVGSEVQYLEIGRSRHPKYINEYWTAGQRRAFSLHEISYRACFKAQLPRFFINLLTREGDVVYDPFSGRGTSIIEAALLNRNVIANDINPLSRILAAPRLRVPVPNAVEKRLDQIPLNGKFKSTFDLSMFYHPRTESEIRALRRYLNRRATAQEEDFIDAWIRMVATNRLTGHSPGFFSVYTLPPNQAVSPERQKKINLRRNQVPPQRDIKKRILKKSKSLVRGLTEKTRKQLRTISKKSLFLTKDARETDEIRDHSVNLIITSPPFLDVVQYAKDNWLRCWFNHIDPEEVARRITMPNHIDPWCDIMEQCFHEFHRVVANRGWIAFEVGEVRAGRIQLEDHIVPIGIQAGFTCAAVVVNRQSFTKTSNIWGVGNNRKGTNSNRIVVFQK